MYPYSKFGTEAKTPDEFPDKDHFQIWIQEEFIAYSGYEADDGVGGREPRWRTYVYEDALDWDSDFRELIRRNLDTTGMYAKQKFVAFKASGKAQIHVSVDFDFSVPESTV